MTAKSPARSSARIAAKSPSDNWKPSIKPGDNPKAPKNRVAKAAKKSVKVTVKPVKSPKNVATYFESTPDVFSLSNVSVTRNDMLVHAVAKSKHLLEIASDGYMHLQIVGEEEIHVHLTYVVNLGYISDSYDRMFRIDFECPCPKSTTHKFYSIVCHAKNSDEFESVESILKTYGSKGKQHLRNSPDIVEHPYHHIGTLIRLTDDVLGKGGLKSTQRYYIASGENWTDPNTIHESLNVLAYGSVARSGWSGKQIMGVDTLTQSLHSKKKKSLEFTDKSISNIHKKSGKYYVDNNDNPVYLVVEFDQNADIDLSFLPDAVTVGNLPAVKQFMKQH